MAVYLPVDDPKDVETTGVDKSKKKHQYYLLYTKVVQYYLKIK